MNEAITITQTAELLNISENSLRSTIRRNPAKYKVTIIENQFYIYISSLPLFAQKRFWKNHCKSNSESQVKGSQDDIVEDKTSECDHDMKVYLSQSDYNRKIYHKYKPLLEKAINLRGEKLLDCIDAWNEKNPEMKTSKSSLYRIRKEYELKGITAIIGKWGKNKNKSLHFDKPDFENQIDDAIVIKQNALLEVCYKLFQDLYLLEGAPSAQDCWKTTYGKWIEISGGCVDLFDGKKFPSAQTFVRKVECKIPKPSIYLARYGDAAYNRKNGLFIDRDVSGISPGEVWVMDHHQIDVAAFAPSLYILAGFNGIKLPKSSLSGRVIYPWITVVQDMRTGKFIGWCLHAEAPNSDHIFQAFHHAASRYGIPRVLYIDNGKDFRCKDFAGGRERTIRIEFDENAMRSIVAALGIKVIFAIPYNAQSKLIERYFRLFKEKFGKFSRGYRGGHAKEKPERCDDEIQKSLFKDWTDFVPLIDMFIEDVLNTSPSNGKYLEGKSPAQAYKELRNDQGYLPHLISEEALSIYCMRIGKEKTIGKNGWYDEQLGRWYWAEWMSGMKGETVYPRRDPRKWQEAWFFNADGSQFIGKATLQFQAAAIAETDLERSQLRDMLRIKNQDKKIAKIYAAHEHHEIEEVMSLMATANSALAPVDGDEDEQTRITRVTRADEIAHEQRRMEREGTYDYPVLLPEEKTETLKIFNDD